MATDTADRLYVVRNSVGVMAYAARLEELDEGDTLVRAGSASWTLSDEMSVTPLEVGETFKHWMYGEIRVTKINRKTIKAVKTATGESVSLGV